MGVLGAGLSGVLMGMQLKRAGYDDFVIYEKAEDVGGTWLRNTWPGLHCDVPSHLYCYSFEPNPDWSMSYAGQPEIQAYIRSCAEKYGLLEHLEFGACVDKASYDEDQGVWIIETASGESHQHRVLVSATGGLTEPNFPPIEGLAEFSGLSWHSGAWRHDVDLSGLRVAIVGSAASAITVVPEVVKHAREAYVFQRSPNWVMPRNNVTFSAEQKEAFKDKAVHGKYWRQLYRGSTLMYRTFLRDEDAIDTMRRVGMKHMRTAIDDPELIKSLTPDYEPGCKRIVVSDDYYPALAQTHAHLIPHAVSGLSPTGVIAVDGSETPVDVVIFCTGYKLGGRADGKPAIEVYGRSGKRLAAALAQRPESYRGVAVPGFPNYFTVCGINGVAAYTSLFYSAEICTEFITKRVGEIVCGDLKSMEVEAEETRRYNEEIQSRLQEMSWATGQCTNFYRDSTGRVLSFHPNTLGRMRRELREVGSRDFILEHNH
ncbi:MAG: NAD(P)/FAD-dependent oxidoreductase [Pseudomonadales bacterium]